MSKGYTEIVYILDRSGSMSGLEADTIGGFNSLIKKQRKEPLSYEVFQDSSPLSAGERFLFAQFIN